MAVLSGKVGLVTGASRGVGRAIARRLAREGAALGILARDPEALNAVAREIAAFGGQAFAIAADVADAPTVERAVSDLEDRFGGLDFLINNAGLSLTAPSADLPIESWDRVLATNLTGAFVCSRAAYPALKRRGGGTIVAIASGAGKQGYSRMAAYSAAKFGLIGLMQALAAEWGPDRIKVSTIAPGSILTEARARLVAAQGGADSAKYISPDDVAEAVVYLLSQPERAWTQEMNLWPF
jgi:3-oxoacyl-[acyl-carrier protein] reductase